jgi:hypothetical protein
MYSIELSEISLEAFEETIKTVELLPSRRVLADQISVLVPRLTKMGVTDLAGLSRLLKDKARYQELADDLSVSEDYLTLLNREVNSHRSKPVALVKLDAFSEAELDRLRAVGVRSTKDLYERCAIRSERVELIRKAGLSERTLIAALELANLVRINGVGPAFARFLRDLGVRSPQDFLETESTDILRRYQETQENGATLRVEDLEYCRRFCVRLSSDIVW